MTSKNISLQKDLYLLVLNLPHRRLIVDDTFRKFQTPPQKKLYSSSGCLLLHCCYYHSFQFTCDKCPYSYNLFEL